MDLQTENRIATILLREAAELRRQAEKEGVDVYLRQPKNRGRPNSRFLTATVLGVQQANRAVEENEMWRARQKERELDDRLKGRSRDRSSSDRRYRSNSDPGREGRKQFDSEAHMSLSPSCSSRKRENEGLKDDEVEQFLHSRTKRGRGAVGSRMDETGPYLPSHSDAKGKQSILAEVDYSERPQRRTVLGPEKPYSLLGSESSDDESSESSEDDESSPERKKRRRKSSSKQSSRKHRSEGKSRDKEKKKKRRSKERRHKHRK